MRPAGGGYSRGWGPVLRPDPSRVVTRLFLPGRETLIPGGARTTPVLDRVLALSEEQVESQLEAVLNTFGPRHRDLVATFAEHFGVVSHRLEAPESLSPARQMLVGAYFTQEYAFQSAALFNPSMVVSPDQSGVAPGAVRFVMSARGVGEGHISSVQFRTGIVDAHDEIILDDPGPHATLPKLIPTTYYKSVFAGQYGRRRGEDEAAEFLLDQLPERFTRAELDRAVESLREQRLARGPLASVVERFDWIATCNYSVRFPEDSRISQRVLMPNSPAEARGIEDVRLVALTGEDAAAATGQPGGPTAYLGTYTAFDGAQVVPQVLLTTDFQTFTITQLLGPAARNKGLALFPRSFDGRFLALSRWDRENSSLAISEDLHNWDDAGIVHSPQLPWELVQVGNCGSPIELPDGWLVLTHGVGPMRQYCISAILLDKADPSVVIGRLPHPLIAAEPGERDGYVPNVTYSCGAMRHRNSLVLPYGVNDSTIRVALVDLPGLLAAMDDRLRPA